MINSFSLGSYRKRQVKVWNRLVGLSEFGNQRVCILSVFFLNICMNAIIYKIKQQFNDNDLINKYTLQLLNVTFKINKKWVLIRIFVKYINQFTTDFIKSHK